MEKPAAATKWILLGTLCWASQGGLLQAEPPRLDRSVEVLRREHAVVARTAQMLGSALNLTQQYGHFQHLEFAASNAVEALTRTLGADPYPPEEKRHLEMALGKIKEYLAIVSRTAEALVPGHKMIRDAMQHLRYTDLALERQGGM